MKKKLPERFTQSAEARSITEKLQRGERITPDEIKVLLPDNLRAAVKVELGDDPEKRSATGTMSIQYPAIEKYAVSGAKVSQSAKRNAEKPRAIVKPHHDSEGESITEIVRALALNRNFEDCTSRELWSQFYAALDERRLDPKESKDTITYETGASDGERTMSFGRFQNLVSGARAEAKKSR
jgi:hypothetical protein